MVGKVDPRQLHCSLACICGGLYCAVIVVAKALHHANLVQGIAKRFA